MVTADQQQSRRSDDDVPRALDALAGLPGFRLAWERTVGDEIQAFTEDPAAAVAAVEVLIRLDRWQIGLGLGPVEAPLPSSTRAARGVAYLDARSAVERAKRAPVPLAVAGPGAADVEAALWLYGAQLARRTAEGWQAADLLAEGLTQTEIAARLGVSPSAVSQRVARAGIEVSDAGRALIIRLLSSALADQEVSEPADRLIS